MKPTKKMLGKLGSPVRERAETAAPEDETSMRIARERAAVTARVAAARAKLAPGELLDRVEDIARVLRKMKEPPPLGVPANGTGNVPSKEVWNAAREQASKRLEALHAQLKATLEARTREKPPEPRPIRASGHVTEATFARELERTTRALDELRRTREER